MSRLDAITRQVYEVVASEQRVGIETIALDVSIEDDLGADSLDKVELIMAIEGEFGIEVEDLEVESIKTVADLVALVDRKQRERAERV